MLSRYQVCLPGQQHRHLNLSELKYSHQHRLKFASAQLDRAILTILANMIPISLTNLRYYPRPFPSLLSRALSCTIRQRNSRHLPPPIKITPISVFPTARELVHLPAQLSSPSVKRTPITSSLSNFRSSKNSSHPTRKRYRLLQPTLHRNNPSLLP